MKLSHHRLPPLLLSALLQLAPLLRVASTEAATIASPTVAVLRWLAGASAVAGSFHAVSAATGLIVTGSTTGTNGVTFAGARAAISSGEFGAAQSYSASGLPPGLTMTRQGVITGKPTTTGVFNSSVTGWQTATPGVGFNFQTTLKLTMVDQPAVIVTQPTNQTVRVGDSVVFSVDTTGTSLTYRWIKDDIELPLASSTAATFTITSAKATDAGSYKVRVTNGGGSTLSSVATLVVNPALSSPPVITNQPMSLTVKEGGIAGFTVAATGTAPLTFQWTFKTVPITAGTNATLNLTNVLTNQAGAYQVKVSNLVTNVLSDIVTLTVTPRPVVGPFSLGALSVSAGGFSFTFPVVADNAYVVEVRDMLGTSNWTVLSNLPPAAVNGTVKITDPAGKPARFYRVHTAL